MVSANTALRCTTCIHVVHMLYNKCMLLTELRRDSPPYGRLSCRSTVHFFGRGKFWTVVALSPFKHCRVTLKILPERQFRLNETSNHFIQGEVVEGVGEGHLHSA